MDGNPQSFAEFWQNIWQMLVDINILRLVWALLVLIGCWRIWPGRRCSASGSTGAWSRVFRAGRRPPPR